MTPTEREAAPLRERLQAALGQAASKIFAILRNIFPKRNYPHGFQK